MNNDDGAVHYSFFGLIILLWLISMYHISRRKFEPMIFVLMMFQIMFFLAFHVVMPKPDSLRWINSPDMLEYFCDFISLQSLWWAIFYLFAYDFVSEKLKWWICISALATIIMGGTAFGTAMEVAAQNESLNGTDAFTVVFNIYPMSLTLIVLFIGIRKSWKIGYISIKLSEPVSSAIVSNAHSHPGLESSNSSSSFSSSSGSSSGSSSSSSSSSCSGSGSESGTTDSISKHHIVDGDEKMPATAPPHVYMNKHQHNLESNPFSNASPTPPNSDDPIVVNTESVHDNANRKMEDYPVGSTRWGNRICCGRCQDDGLFSVEHQQKLMDDPIEPIPNHDNHHQNKSNISNTNVNDGQPQFIVLSTLKFRKQVVIMSIYLILPHVFDIILRYLPDCTMIEACSLHGMSHVVVYLSLMFHALPRGPSIWKDFGSNLRMCLKSGCAYLSCGCIYCFCVKPYEYFQRHERLTQTESDDPTTGIYDDEEEIARDARVASNRAKEKAKAVSSEIDLPPPAEVELGTVEISSRDDSQKLEQLSDDPNAKSNKHDSTLHVSLDKLPDSSQASKQLQVNLEYGIEWDSHFERVHAGDTSVILSEQERQLVLDGKKQIEQMQHGIQLKLETARKHILVQENVIAELKTATFDIVAAQQLQNEIDGISTRLMYKTSELSVTKTRLDANSLDIGKRKRAVVDERFELSKKQDVLRATMSESAKDLNNLMLRLAKATPQIISNGTGACDADTATVAVKRHTILSLPDLSIRLTCLRIEVIQMEQKIQGISFSILNLERIISTNAMQNDAELSESRRKVKHSSNSSVDVLEYLFNKNEAFQTAYIKGAEMQQERQRLHQNLTLYPPTDPKDASECREKIKELDESIAANVSSQWHLELEIKIAVTSNPRLNMDCINTFHPEHRRSDSGTVIDQQGHQSRLLASSVSPPISTLPNESDTVILCQTHVGQIGQLRLFKQCLESQLRLLREDLVREEKFDQNRLASFKEKEAFWKSNDSKSPSSRSSIVIEGQKHEKLVHSDQELAQTYLEIAPLVMPLLTKIDSTKNALDLNVSVMAEVLGRLSLVTREEKEIEAMWFEYNNDVKSHENDTENSRLLLSTLKGKIQILDNTKSELSRQLDIEQSKLKHMKSTQEELERQLDAGVISPHFLEDIK